VGHEDPGLAPLRRKSPGQALAHRRPGDVHYNDYALGELCQPETPR
jgi:hypothetical protein